MAPPSIARMNAQRKGYASRLESPIAPSKVEKPAQESKEPKMEYFPEFPTEIQEMIWREAMQKPACHTLRFLQTKTWDKTMMDVAAKTSFRDTSSWRYWKSLVYCRRYKQPMDEPDEKSMKKKTSKVGAQNPKAKKSKAERPKLEGSDLERFNQEKENLQSPSESSDEETPPKSRVQKSHEAFSKLANASFQAGFRRSMLQLVKVTASETSNQAGVVIDVGTDLVILDFNRGENARPNSWFEHTGLGDLAIHDIRMQTRDLKRVAVHYKRTHANAHKRGPFQCWCANPATLECNQFKACPMEQACFLDCFANLEEFYHVVEIQGKKAAAWFHDYRKHARMFDYNLRTSSNGRREGPRIPLAHFYDQKYEYIQLPPIHRLRYIVQWGKARPFDFHKESSDCLQTVIDIYKGKKGKTDKDDFSTPLQQRTSVKFGILFAIKRDDIKHDDETEE